MPNTHRTRRINPRLGTYFGIFVSAFLSLMLMATIGEQMGASDSALRWIMLLVPLGFYAAIGLSGQTQDPADFFAAGRRVPAFFTGLGLGASALGGVGVVSVAGLMMTNGIDAWSIVNGIVAGLVVGAVLIGPYLRKFGSYTLPSYLGRRFDSRLLRLIAAATLCAPLLLIVVAEIKIGMTVATRMTGASDRAMAILLAVTIFATVGAGGVRSMSWAIAAAGLATILALIIPAGIVATEVTNFPLAQFSYGPTLRAIGRLEDIRGIAAPLLSPLSFDFATTALEPLTHRMSRPFGSLGPASYILLSLTLMIGIAVAPWLTSRIGATPGIYEARKSFGWAVFIFGVIMLTVSAVAVFERDIVMEQLVGQSAATLPEWLKPLIASGDAAVDGRLPQLPLSSFSFKRDTLLFMLPVATHLPSVLLYLVMTGAIAAAFCGACSGILALGTILGEDVINGSQWEAPNRISRLLVARAMTGIAAIAGAGLALSVPADPLQLAIWALGLCGATAFPIVVLSIWWKRLNTLGAISGIVTGFSVAAFGIAAGEANWFGVPSEVVSAFAVPFAFAAAFIGTRIGAAPGRHILELVRDMRVPGGETVHDREQRLLRLKRRQRPA